MRISLVTHGHQRPGKNPVEAFPRPIFARAKEAVRRLLVRLAEVHAGQAELCERQRLVDRPWEGEFLHWAQNGATWELHGQRIPPAGRRLGATKGGWCLCGRG